METSGNTQQVLQHHLTAFIDNNIEDIMKDYSEESFLCTPQGKISGMASIRSFFSEVFILFPVGKSKLDLQQMFTEKELAYIAWYSDSPAAEIPMGTDSFLIVENKIRWQTLAAHIILK